MSKWIKRNFSNVMKLKVDEEQIIIDVESVRGKLYITYNPKLMKYFEGFTDKSKRRYFRIWIDDLYNLANENIYAWDWKVQIMLHSDTSNPTSNTFLFKTKSIKDFLGLTKESYMREGGFDRYNFEKRCIIAPLENLAKTQQITIWHNYGKPYTKIKPSKSNSAPVEGYLIEYRLYDDIKKKSLYKEDVKYGE